MKLLNFTAKFYALIVVPVILLCGVISFEILRSLINKQFNHQLVMEKDQLMHELELYQSLKQTYYLNIGDRIDIKPVEQAIAIEPVLSDTLMFDPYAGDYLNFRQYRFQATVDGHNYMITISKSLLSTEKLVKVIGEIMIILLVSLLLSMVLINRYLSKKIWRPFYQILDVIRQFDVTRPFTMPEAETKVEEFIELKNDVENILTKTKKDYLSLKEFTENSSHEIQTPLAVIKSKAELLMQSSRIKDEEILEVKSIYDEVQRLSRLNQSLILLTKIENEQYVVNSSIKVATYIDTLLASFTEFIEIRDITVRKKFDSDPEMIINEELAYTLFSNLLNNAIKHNTENGFIEIKVRESEIVFSNSGNPIHKDPQQFFDRFKKGNISSSPGLGLSIVKRICDLYGINVTYSYSGNIHKVVIVF